MLALWSVSALELLAHDISPYISFFYKLEGIKKIDFLFSKKMKNIFSFNKTRRKPQRRRSQLVFLSITSLLLLFIIIIISFKQNPKSLFSIQTLYDKRPQCSARILNSGEKFLWYAPHSGFNNQLSEFKNGLLIAGILNRTLIIPPVLDHHAVALGSCPKFRVTDPKEIRMSVWNHAIELLRTGRYVSISDIIDISSLVSTSSVRTLDFRVFASMWCGVNVDSFCFDKHKPQSSFFDSLKQCGYLLSGHNGKIDNCLYPLDEDCRTTVWTYQNSDGDGVLDSLQPDEQLKKKKNISYVRKRRDVYKTLGSGSEADSAAVLAFGSLFTAPYKNSELYIDIQEARRDPRIQSLIENIKFLPFVREIVNASKKFVLDTIKDPFICTQLRMLDGQFKNHWKVTFESLKQKLESLRHNNGYRPISIFVMTDLPEVNWTGNYLGDLARESDSFKLYALREDSKLVTQTAQSLQRTLDGFDKNKKFCPSLKLPKVLLYIEETICSCGSLGFVGTAGSTIAESIGLMRKFDVCSAHNLTAK